MSLPTLPTKTRTQTESAFQANWAKQTGNISFLIIAIGTVVFLTLLLVTGNTMAISVRERIGELAVLKAIGFSDLTILFFVLGESLVISVVGAALGLALAVFAVPIISKLMNGLLPRLIVDPSVLITGLFTGVLVGIISGSIAGHNRHAHARGQCSQESLILGTKIFFGFLVTVLAIVALLSVVAIVAGLLAPLIGSVPISYNFRSIRARWTSTIVAVLGIAGTVGVFVAMLSLAHGFKATLVASGSPGNALLLRAGSPSEMLGGVTLDSVKIVQDAPGIARDASGPLITQEVVGVIPFPLITTGTDANVQGARCLPERTAYSHFR